MLSASDWIRCALVAALTLPAALALCADEPPIYTPLECLNADDTFGSIAALPDGRIFTWTVHGKTMEDADVKRTDIAQKAFGRYSDDGGRTWSEPRVLFEFPLAPGTRLPGPTFCDRNGVLHLFGDDYFSTDWQTTDPAKSRLDLWHAMSPDSGKTWSPAQRLDFGHTYAGDSVTCVQLASGRLLMPIAYWSSRATGKFIGSAMYSDDGGETWRRSPSDLVVDSGHGDVESGAIEPTCIELRDGRVWMLLRTQTGYQYESFSEDGGETWGEPAQSRFVDTNAPAQFLRLRDGRIVLVWNDCSFDALPGPCLPRAVLSAAISADDGKTWRGYREIARVNTAGIVAYPYLAQTTDGTVLVRVWQGSLLLRLDPDWLNATSLNDDFSQGLPEWSTLGTEGVALADHPDKAGHKVLRLRKTNPDKASATLRNFPFGVAGRLTLRLRAEPGFGGARIALNDFYSLPPVERSGRFSVRLAADGWLHITQGDGGEVAAAQFPTGRWLTLSFVWDCRAKQCKLLLNDKWVATLPQLLAPDLAQYPPNLADGQKAPEAEGLCYLRLSSTAEKTDEAGLTVESVHVRVDS